jgi:MraZ protein
VFLGKAFHTLDEKGRVVLPARFRGQLEDDGCVVAKGRDGSLVLYPFQDFQEKAGEMKARPETPQNRRLLRTFAAEAEYQRLDKQGRVMIPEELRNFAGLQANVEVAVLGVIDHIEIWSRDAHLADQARGDREYLETEEEATTA